MMSKDKKAIEALEDLGKDLVKTVLSNKPPVLNVPIRALSNTMYNAKSQTLELGDKVSERNFFNVAHSKKFLQTLEVAAVSKDLLNEGKHASLRDVFYMIKRTIPNTKTNVVDDQPESDDAIEDLEVLSGYSREQLNINANKMGSVAGHVVHEDKFWDKQNCIIMSSQGQTTRGIRRLLQRLSQEFDLPIYFLADADPWGYYIYSVLKYGSINLAHMSGSMTLNTAKFLGITVDDIEKYGLKKHLITFQDVDHNRLEQLQNYEWVKSNKEWQRQFKMMKALKAKAEIQALSSRGLSFITDKYLPEKIKNKEWIE